MDLDSRKELIDIPSPHQLQRQIHKLNIIVSALEKRVDMLQIELMNIEGEEIYE